nr:hypothetical protein B0A51_13574 [Rachicladosporium sp. CCFEE 5018]OQO24090.1 hypothetical protein B0A51_05933 [Rachicladosporium sp. CCFEE 5018]
MKMRSGTSSAVCCALLAARCTSAIQLTITDANSIKTAASTAAHGMMSYYKGNITGGTPGLLPQPYYWWEGGAMWGSLIDYWSYTGDTTYNDIVSESLLFQVGPDDDFMPPNQTKSLGNDDQAFWGMAAMTAAEAGFPNPPSNQPQWLALAQAVFNTQAVRWDNSTCGGGLRWQIYSFNNGYNYKNSISQGGFFNIAARLGLYTKNETYFDWANQMWDWTNAIGLISDSYQVFDGSDDTLNCTELNHIQWSYNTGIFLSGAAVMYNVTTGAEQAKWKTRVQGLITGANAFFYQGQGIMYEVACEPNNNCNTDQQSFKAYLLRWMTLTIKLAPWTHDTLLPLIQTTATAAAKSCVGGSDGVTCGTKWYEGNWDGTYGVGQQMNAMEAFQALLVDQVGPPLSNSTGGTSVGNAAAGTGPSSVQVPQSAITTKDKAGAGILTTLVLITILGGAWWMIA